MRHHNVRNADEVEAREMIKGRLNMRLRQLGKPAGSRALGATLTEVAPGAVSFPRHAHHANEEAIYVLSGSGEARIGEERVAVRPGDWIALPAGPSHAHQMVNSSATDPLVYLCVSTMHRVEIVEYPDSGKVGAELPIRQARLASAALASSVPGVARSTTGRESPRPARDSSGLTLPDGVSPSRSCDRRTDR